MVILHLNIKAGMAISGPPLGPTLGQYGIAIGPFCDSFNEQTVLFRNSYPLNVYLYLNKDGSYNYYIYFPRIVFFLRKLLRKEEGAANTPRYLYFIGYIIMKISELTEMNRGTTLLCKKIDAIFQDQSLELEKIDIRPKYNNTYVKGSFRSITPELLFETIIFYNMSSLEIKGFFSYFFELRDYFIIDYVPFFFFFDYVRIYSEILYKYNLDLDNLTTNKDSLDSMEGEGHYNIHSIFSKYNNLSKIIEIAPRLIDFYVSYFQLEELTNVEFYSVEYLYYYADLLSNVSNMDLNCLLLNNNFIGYDFNYFSFLRSIDFIENPLILCTDFFLNEYFIMNSIDLDMHIEHTYFVENNVIFMFSMYVSSLYFSQYEYYTDSDFRDISKCENRFKQLINYLEQQGIFLMTKNGLHIDAFSFRNQYFPLHISKEELFFNRTKAWIA
jgi:ribosomal protein L11